MTPDVQILTPHPKPTTHSGHAPPIASAPRRLGHAPTWAGLGATALGLIGLLAAGSAPAQTCRAQSGATAPVLLELYTSEGCSSCPPADRFVTGLSGRSDVVALAFHVDYWDGLGWADRYASPAYTQRQKAQIQPSGARFAYTPQLIVQGRDWPQWPGALPAAQPARFDLSLMREGRQLRALVAPRAPRGEAPAGAAPLPAQVAAYWAWTENGHVSQVRLGENAGRTLAHDAVVRAYAPQPAWPSAQPRQLDWTAPVAERPGQAVLVITDAQTQRPLQALAIGC
jgi:hypothetical protein